MLVEKDKDIREILEKAETIAIVGCSPHWEKASHMVPAFLQEQGYRIVPVNPEYHEILGEKCYASLRDIPYHINIVDCFRPSREISGIAEDAIAIGADVLWTQLGIINHEAGKIASQAGLKVVMNRCPHVEIPRLFNMD